MQGLREVAGNDIEIEFAESGLFSSTTPKADLGIAVVGESPYAEGWGDNPTPQLSPEDIETIEHLKSSSKKVIVVLVTGRPLIITSQLPKWDALVVAWLPGSEGAGVADVLFGKKPFSGRLPISWPASLEQLPISVEGTTENGTPLLFNKFYSIKK